MNANNVVLAGFVALLVAVPAAAQEPPAQPKPLFEVVDRSWANSLAFAPDGQRLACNLVLRNLAGKELSTGEVGGEYHPCMHVAFSPDGKRFASVHFDDGLIDARHAICLWDVTADNKLKKVAKLDRKKEPRTAHRRSMYSLTFSHDSSMLATREQDDSTVVWDTATGKERLRLETHGLVVGFTPDGRTLVAVTRDGLVQHWDLATKKCAPAPDQAKRDEYFFVVNAVASADGTTVALMDEYSVILKDARSGKTLRRFDNLDAYRLTLSADGKTLVVATYDRVATFDRESGRERAHLKTDRAWVRALALSPDGKLLAVGTNMWTGQRDRESVAVWETAKLAAPKGEIKRDPPAPGLEAKLTSKQEAYTLALGGKTADEFARQLGRGNLPPATKVDLVLTLRNTTSKPMTIDGDVSVSLYLTGHGAMNHPEEVVQTEGRVPGEERKKVVIAPGKSHDIPVRALKHGYGAQSHWLLPGEYSIHAGCYLIVDPAPAGTLKLGDTRGSITLKAPQLRVKVVAEKK
jgi:WD40 repeat protein